MKFGRIPGRRSAMLLFSCGFKYQFYCLFETIHSVRQLSAHINLPWSIRPFHISFIVLVLRDVLLIVFDACRWNCSSKRNCMARYKSFSMLLESMRVRLTRTPLSCFMRDTVNMAWAKLNYWRLLFCTLELDEENYLFGWKGALLRFFHF